MSLYENVYTDALKDVVGDEPVLDQFDIFYEASYYGTVQDDYVTGTLVNRIPNPNLPGGLSFTTGSRGKVFSKLYANSQPPLDTSYGTTQASNWPSLSLRLVPWSSKVSRTATRLSQAYDENERYYDSCLPDLNNCFSANGSNPWTLKNPSHTLVSPYGNFQTGSNDVFLIFNYPEQEVEGYENDPTVDNTWTWSFPYETKFKPERRLLSTDQSFGLTQVTTESDIEIVEPLDIYAKNFEFWETSVPNQNLKINSVSSTPAKIARVFRPILPGLNQTMGLRNSLRQTITSPYAGENGPRYLLPTSYEDSTLDASYGYSLLFPSDVNLFAAGDHTFLSYYGVNDPGNNALTGSMYPSDTIKFLFGFGDLNTITYAYRKFEPSNVQIAYEQSFESYNNADSLTLSTSAYETRGLKASWSGDWLVREKAGEVSVGGNASWYYPNSTSGIYWTKDAENTKILFSETTVGASEEKIECLHVTSSYPWSIKFDFSVASDWPEDLLKVTITGSNWTDTNILLLDTSDNIAPDVFFRDNGLAEGYSETFTELPGEQKTSPVPHATGGTYDWDVVGAKGDAMGQFYYTGSNTYPIPAGEYRIQFLYQTFGGSSTITCAAIDNISIKVYDESCFPPDESKGKMGGNNYPEFRTYKVDAREDPTYAYKVPGDYGTMSSILQDKTSLVYSGIHFGISPIIRGWKYGLINGFPHHTKVIFRRGRYGQFRDMLEQRQYTKFVNSNVSPTDFDAITVNGFDKTLNTSLPVQGSKAEVSLSEAIANVKFVRKITRISQRGIGTIDTEVINPEQTTSQNLSFEVTSSLPYFDLESRHRTHEEMTGVKRSSYVDTATVIASDQQLGII